MSGICQYLRIATTTPTYVSNKRNIGECGGFFLAYVRGLTESLKFKLADARGEVLSIAQGLNSVLPRCWAQRFLEKGPGGGRRRLENGIISVLWVFKLEFPCSEVFECRSQ